jgi:hypothetical protein
VAEERPHCLRAVSCHELEDQEHLNHRGEPSQSVCEQDVERTCLPRKSRNKILRIAAADALAAYAAGNI